MASLRHALRPDNGQATMHKELRPLTTASFSGVLISLVGKPPRVNSNGRRPPSCIVLIVTRCSRRCPSRGATAKCIGYGFCLFKPAGTIRMRGRERVKSQQCNSRFVPGTCARATPIVRVPELNRVDHCCAFPMCVLGREGGLLHSNVARPNKQLRNDNTAAVVMLCSPV